MEEQQKHLNTTNNRNRFQKNQIKTIDSKEEIVSLAKTLSESKGIEHTVEEGDDVNSDDAFDLNMFNNELKTHEFTDQNFETKHQERRKKYNNEC